MQRDCEQRKTWKRNKTKRGSRTEIKAEADGKRGTTTPRESIKGERNKGGNRTIFENHEQH